MLSYSRYSRFNIMQVFKEPHFAIRGQRHLTGLQNSCLSTICAYKYYSNALVATSICQIVACMNVAITRVSCIFYCFYRYRIKKFSYYLLALQNYLRIILCNETENIPTSWLFNNTDNAYQALNFKGFQYKAFKF